MGTDPGDALNDMLAQARSLADAVQRAWQPLPEEFRSTDSSGAVTVTLAEHGRRVTGVMLAADWQGRLAPESLGSAVLEAVLSPQLTAAQGALSVAGEAEDSGATPAPKTPPTADPDAVARVSQLNASDMDRMLATVQRAFDRLASLSDLTIAATGAVVGRSRNRMVQVSLMGGQPTEVTVDARWAARVPRQSVCDSLREAFEEAYTARAAQADAQADDAIIAELESIVETFAGRLRMAAPTDADDGRRRS